MKGKISFHIKNKQIAFKFVLERNVTILTGDSGTGKTKLVNMVRNYSREGKASGITLKCSKPCIVLDDNNWDIILERTSNSIVFVEESTRFLSAHEFAGAISDTDNYYVFVTREPLPQISYSIDAIKQIIRNNSKPKIEKLYSKVSVKDISGFPYDLVIVEDSKTGFQFFTKAAGKWNVSCETANGKSNILSMLNKPEHYCSYFTFLFCQILLFSDSVVLIAL